MIIKLGPRMSPADRVLLWGLGILALPALIDITGRAKADKYVLLVLVVAVGVGYLADPCTKSRQVAGLMLCAGAYLTFKVTAFAFGGSDASWADWIQAYKAYLFLPLVIFAAGRPLFTLDGLARVTKLLIVIFGVKYAAVVATGGHRPVVWFENNFELMVPIGLLYLVRDHLGPHRIRWVVALCGVVILSGSRSSALEIGLVLAMLYLAPSATPRSLVPRVVACVCGGWILWQVIMSRLPTSGGVQSIDRVHFFNVFRASTTDWAWSNWLLGTWPLTPLPGISCGRLTAYRGLFAGHGLYSGDGADTCYSVVLHSYVLRGMWDQGVLGLSLLLVVLWICLWRVSGRATAVVILGIGLLNSLSVSAFNSEFFALIAVAAVAAGATPRSAELSGSDSPVEALPRRSSPAPLAAIR